MKKEISKSHSLKRRLLIALITCLLTVMIICTALFEAVYRRTTDTVDDHFGKLTDIAYDEVTDTLCADDLECMRGILNCYCREMSYEMNQGFGGVTEDDISTYLATRAGSYFDDIYITKDIFFVIDNDGITAVDLFDGRHGTDADTVVKNAFETFEKTECDDLDGLSFEEYLLSNKDLADARYTKEGDGYIIVWKNMSEFSGHSQCVGLLSNACVHWKGQMKSASDMEIGELHDNMDLLFRKYTIVMLSAVGGVLVLFIIIAAVLSKKLSDPVVSEHDMLVEINEMKTTFLSDASHELKTPLAAMSGYAQNAEYDLENGSTDAVKEKLKRISSEANRMALMVTQILDATRIEEGRLVLDPSPCDLDALVRETVETYFVVLNKNNNRLALRIPLDLPKVQADSARMQRVFVNLISNSLKHTHNGTILIRAEEEGSEIKVTVKDTGCGISEEDLPHIWERYYKGKHSETGTGLGLFICRFIVESHGGKIWVESEVGKGTSFMLTLPVSPGQTV
ncbi:sensor histidine kinase [Ruminococcus albus]|uniref:histidine kinase n=1 Tax=Ruminococcus albus TaxID=1264 RepID=A0A1H7I3D5_RUMAL|nr:HAMP domain-containing sensor histidine kinase [Ruminococcus albus]SEK57103.1 Signal transduction histidine kinase [Ruminococcus albus]